MGTAVVRQGQGKLRQDVEVGRHRLVADEPAEKGGEDSGPNPFEYLAAALGSCTAITLRMYALRKAWPLEGAKVAVSIEKDEARALFNRTIELAGPLDDAQRARLLKVAEACPVHKLLSGKIEIQTRLV